MSFYKGNKIEKANKNEIFSIKVVKISLSKINNIIFLMILHFKYVMKWSKRHHLVGSITNQIDYSSGLIKLTYMEGSNKYYISLERILYPYLI